MALVYQCERCKTTAAPEHGDQRDPGPFPPKEWEHLQRRRGGSATLCPACSADLGEWLATTPHERVRSDEEPF